MTTLGQLAAILDSRTAIGSGVLLILALLVVFGPKWITAYAELKRVSRDQRRPSDDD
jgi:hypothetical protein